ncbi:MAG TPA: hypothetical protein VE133_15740, partial [Candidatus Sulfotelmatobacter sp.]|nr:hypothetical protein [Candidatus Sulfotelmatobacter sp.]
MKVRTITLGLPGQPDGKTLEWAGKCLGRAVAAFEAAGYTVQTRRIALEHWDAGLGKVLSK